MHTYGTYGQLSIGRTSNTSTLSATGLLYNVKISADNTADWGKATHPLVIGMITGVQSLSVQ